MTVRDVPGQHAAHWHDPPSVPAPAGPRRLRQECLPRRTPGHHGRGAGSAPSACHGDCHRRLAGRTAPAAPGGLAPRPCQSPHPDLPALPPSQPSFPRKREATSPRSNGGTTGGLRTGNPRYALPCSHRPAIPTHHPPSASCHPGTAPPAVLLHRVYGLLTPTPITRPAPACPPKTNLS